MAQRAGVDLYPRSCRSGTPQKLNATDEAAARGLFNSTIRSDYPHLKIVTGVTMRILHVVGARPNFMKAAPVIEVLRQSGVRQTLVHTGQHYDATMSEVFFRQLGMQEPDINLAVGSG